MSLKIILRLYKITDPWTFRHALSEVAFGHIRTLAARHPRTKFVSIVGDKCIPNYPDRLLPTLFIYRKGEIVNQQVAWGASKPHTIDGEHTCMVVYHTTW